MNPIEQTQNWVKKVVLGFNFCPFAHRVVEQQQLRYVLAEEVELESVLRLLLNECKRLDIDPGVETTLLILPQGFDYFQDYLELLDLADALIYDQGYEGIYQLASFHPEYVFADTAEDDPANYTNRSPFPMLHLLREESIEKAVNQHPDPNAIPARNVEFAREKGIEYMQKLFKALRKDKD